MASKPTIVIVPGAWHNATHFTPLKIRLEKAGYDVKPLTLSSAGANGSDPANDGDYTPDVELISSTIRTASDAGNDVVLVMHSAGGVTGSEASKSLSKAERSASGLPGGIIRLVYLAAFALPEGAAIYNAEHPPSDWIDVFPSRDFEGTKLTIPHDPIYQFYHDCDPAEAEKAAATIGKHSYAAKASPVTYAAWKHTPSTYLVCEADRALVLAVQEMWINQPGANFEVERCHSAHSPFMSMPDFTAEVVRRAAGEKI